MSKASQTTGKGAGSGGGATTSTSRASAIVTPREASLARQPLTELASDHAGRADDENFHFWLLPAPDRKPALSGAHANLDRFRGPAKT